MVGLTPRAAEGRLARYRKSLEDEQAGTEPHATRTVRHAEKTATTTERNELSNRDVGTAQQESPEAKVDQYFKDLLGASSIRTLAAAA